MLSLADLDKAELLSLIEYAGLYAQPEALREGWRGVLASRFEGAKAEYERAYTTWLPLSVTARADAEAARLHRENRGADDMWVRKLEISKASTRRSNEAWEQVRAADRVREKIALQLRLVGKLP